MMHVAPEPEILLGTAETAALDAAAAAAGLTMERLMQAAGEAVADAIPSCTAISVLCGPGNNGGDGYVAARLLAARGLSVKVFADHPPRQGSAAAWAAGLWPGAVEPLSRFVPTGNDVVIDALFGAGMTRPIMGETAAAVTRLNASGAIVVAVDLPSGLDGDSGQATGPVVQATLTVGFFRARPGHLLWPGRGFCGRLILADIGLTGAHLQMIAAGTTFRNSPGLWRHLIARQHADTHKYDRGHCLVVSGSQFQTGAARLSAEAALNAGAGAVSLAGEDKALKIHAAHVTAIMLKQAAAPDDLRGLLASARFQAAIIGPAAGVGHQTRARTRILLESGLPLVLDADALTVMSDAPEHIAQRPERSHCVLTPHAGEFRRLFGSALPVEATYCNLPTKLRASKVEMARAAARITNAVIVFKGIDTVIADADGRCAINDNAGPELATAGSGDVLAGLIGAHLAQGMPAFEAAAAAVWLHGACGAAFGPGLTADRLVDLVRPVAVLASLAPGETLPSLAGTRAGRAGGASLSES